MRLETLNPDELKQAIATATARKKRWWILPLLTVAVLIVVYFAPVVISESDAETSTVGLTITVLLWLVSGILAASVFMQDITDGRRTRQQLLQFLPTEAIQYHVRRRRFLYVEIAISIAGAQVLIFIDAIGTPLGRVFTETYFTSLLQLDPVVAATVYIPLVAWLLVFIANLAMLSFHTLLLLRAQLFGSRGINPDLSSMRVIFWGAIFFLIAQLVDGLGTALPSFIIVAAVVYFFIIIRYLKLWTFNRHLVDVQPLFNNGEYSKVLLILNNLPTVHTGVWYVHLYRAQLYASMEPDMDYSVERDISLVQLQHADAMHVYMVFYYAVRRLHAVGNDAQADRVIRSLITIDPTNFSAYHLMIIRCLDLGRNADAIETSEWFDRIVGNETRTDWMKPHVIALQGNFELARQILDMHEPSAMLVKHFALHDTDSLADEPDAEPEPSYTIFENKRKSQHPTAIEPVSVPARLEIQMAFAHSEYLKFRAEVEYLAGNTDLAMQYLHTGARVDPEGIAGYYCRTRAARLSEDDVTDLSDPTLNERSSYATTTG